MIVVPLSDARTGVEKIVEHFGVQNALAKGDEKSVTLSFKSDLSSVLSLSMPGKIGEMVELKRNEDVRVILTAFRGEKAGIAYVFFFKGEELPEELKTIVKSLELIKERVEVRDVDIGGFATAKLPEGYDAEGRTVMSQTCPGYSSGVYMKVSGPDGGSFEFVYGEFSFGFYSNMNFNDPTLEELMKQSGTCFYGYVDLATLKETFGKGEMENCYTSVEDYTESVISLVRERYPDLEVESVDVDFKNQPEIMNSKLYILTSRSNPMFVAYVLVSGFEREDTVSLLPYGVMDMKLLGGSVALMVIDAKSAEEFSVFMNLKDDLRFKEDWLSRNMMRLKECNRVYMEEIRKDIAHSREISNMITETMRDISAMHWDSWEKEQRFQEEMSESMTRILSDYTAVRDPETQEVYEVENFAQRYWINDEGQILGTSWDVSESDLIAKGWRPMEENPAGFIRGLWG